MIARIIRKALEILNGKTGIEWVKGEMGFLDVKYDSEAIESMFDLDQTELAHVRQVCTLGALELATRFEGFGPMDYSEVAGFVAGVGESKGLVSGYFHGPVQSNDIATFNDKNETTQNDVVGLLRAALVKAEALPLGPTPERELAPIGG